MTEAIQCGVKYQKYSSEPFQVHSNEAKTLGWEWKG